MCENICTISLNNTKGKVPGQNLSLLSQPSKATCMMHVSSHHRISVLSGLNEFFVLIKMKTQFYPYFYKDKILEWERIRFPTTGILEAEAYLRSGNIHRSYYS
jgi:hypothetical protein